MLGEVVVERPYYHCNRCGAGCAPRDQELDVEGTQYSPGVRRMTALVGSETSFDRGRALLDELAGVQLTTKAVEREAEAIGADIADHEQAEISRAVQFELPEIFGEDTPILYIEMDGTGVPVTGKTEPSLRLPTAGRKGKAGGPARTREVKLGCVFTQTSCDDNGRAATAVRLRRAWPAAAARRSSQCWAKSSSNESLRRRLRASRPRVR